MEKFVLSLIIIILLGSCNKEKPGIDLSQITDQIIKIDDIDSWIMANESLILAMGRAEFNRYDYLNRKAIYKVLPAQKKFEFWQDKLSEEISLKDDPIEIEHIYQLYNNLNVNVFINENDRIDFIEFCSLWMEDGIEQFNWDLNNVGLITMTLYPSINFGEYYKMAMESKKTYKKSYMLDPGDLECDCNWGWWCGGRCEDESCFEVLGCGFLYLQYCDTLCNEDRFPG